MSDLLSGLLSQFGGSALSQIAKSIGTDENTAQSALGSAIPILISALAKNSSTAQGAESLNNALDKDHDGGILDNLAGFLGGGSAENIGGGILDHVLGAKTGNIEKYVSDDSGLSSSAVSSLLKMAAPVVLGYLSKQKSQSGGGADMLSSMLGAAVSNTASNAPQSQSVISQLLDQNNDGNVIDDVARLGMSFLGNFFKK